MRRSRTLTPGRVALRQVRSRWTSFVPTTVGLAAALALAVAVTLTQARTEEASLVQSLSGLGSQGVITVRLTGVRQLGDYQRFQSDVARAAREQRGLVTPRSSLLYSGTYSPLTINGVAVITLGPAYAEHVTPTQVAVRDDLATHVDLVAGSWPASPTTGKTTEATMSEDAAAAARLKLGDTQCMRMLPPYQYVTCFHLAAIWRSHNQADPYWASDQAPPVAAFTDYATYFAILKAEAEVDSNPQLVSVGVVTLTPDINAIRAAGAQASLIQLSRLHADFGVARRDAVVISSLENALDKYVSQNSIAAFAVQLVAVQLLLIALYCVWFLAGAMLEQQRQVIAVWRSRGWSWGGVTALLTFELGVVAIVALPVGAAGGWAASDVISRLAYGDQSIPGFHLDLARIAPLLAAVLLAEVAVLVARAMLTARHGVLRSREAASRPRVPWWRKRHIDLVLGLLAIPLIAQVSLLGSASVRAARSVNDPITLVLPGIAIAFVAMAALRLLPLGAGLLALARRSVPARLASMQLLRAPGQHAGLAILLMVAIALGVFASAFVSTAKRNAADRASYQVGADVRGTFGGAVTAVPDQIPLASTVAKSSVFRGYGRVGNEDAQLLAVDPYTFGPVMFTRGDLASTPLPALVESLADKETGGLLLPADASTIALFAHGSNTGGNITVHLGDEHGRPVHADLGSLDFRGWKQLTAQLIADGGARSGKLRFRDFAISGVATAGEIGLSAFTTGSIVLEPFNEPYPPMQIYFLSQFLWWRTEWDTGATGEALVPSPDITRDGQLSVHFRVVPAHIPTYIRPPIGSPDPTKSFAPPPGSTCQPPPAAGQPQPAPGQPTGPCPPQVSFGPAIPAAGPVPAIVSSGLLTRFGLSIGKTMDFNVDRVGIKGIVVGVAGLFPTLYPELGDFVVVLRDPLLVALANGGHQRPWPNEIWGHAAPGAIDALVAAMRQAPANVDVLDRRLIESTAAHSPQQLELQSNLALGFIAATALGLLAFVLHFLALARSRLSDYAVLEANGMQQRLIRRSLLIEQLVLVSFCVVCGAVLGLIASLAVLPGLQLSASAADNVPQTIVTFDVALVGLVLATVFVGSITAGVALAAAIERPRVMSELRSLG